jgi:hypothetical protein
VQALAQPQHAAPQPLVVPDHREALLCQRFQAHKAAVSSILVLTDTGTCLADACCRFNM